MVLDALGGVAVATAFIGGAAIGGAAAVAVWRAGKWVVAPLICVLLVVSTLAAAVAVLERVPAGRTAKLDGAAAVGEAAAEHRVLAWRQAELAVRSAGSPLACLNPQAALAGEAVARACEEEIFAGPASVTAAVSFAAAQVRLLADGLDYARRTDPAFEAAFADLRAAVEKDAYGIFAHVLAIRYRCTAEQCDAFALLRDPARLKLNLRQRRYDLHLEQHSARWEKSGLPEIAGTAAPGSADMASGQAATAVPMPRPRSAAAGLPAGATSESAAAAQDRGPAAAPSTGGRTVPPVASVLPNIDFPSPASIPPISIMTLEPALPAAAERDAARPEPAPAGGNRSRQ